VNASTLYDGAFELGDFLNVSMLVYEDGEGLQITATPELANAGARLSRPLEFSPKGLRETATNRPLVTFPTAKSTIDGRQMCTAHHHEPLPHLHFKQSRHSDKGSDPVIVKDEDVSDEEMPKVGTDPEVTAF
jgi:hypothetical protein